MINYYLAIDIGASSGRHIIGWVEDGMLKLEEVYRFENIQIHKNGHDCWDTQKLWDEILRGLKACKKKNKIPVTLGIDTWGVDFILLDRENQVVGDAVTYRDARTRDADSMVEEKISKEQLYRKTGVQKAPYNTIYQLAALQKEHPEQLEEANRLLMMPDYYNFLLTGVKKNEYTIATTSNLVHAENRDWDRSVISAMGFPQRLFCELSMPGTVVGAIRPDVAEEIGFTATVVLPACHDTGSAFLAIPATGDNAVYISSGTWSLLGVESNVPIVTQQSYEQNFTNEGGAWGRYRILKNIMGLWIVQSVRRELNGVAYVRGRENETQTERKWSFAELIAEAKREEGFHSVIDVNKDCFLSPDSMIREIRDECSRMGQPVPGTVAEIMQCVYTSLGLCYRDAISKLETVTGKKYTSINIVGGGCQDQYLNEKTAQITGLKVHVGPVEGSAIGNILVQMIRAKELQNLQAARDLVRNSLSFL